MVRWASGLRRFCNCVCLAVFGLAANSALIGFEAQAASNVPIYVFRGTVDGGNPEAGLILGRDGLLYGTADRGGGSGRNSGVVFSLAPPATRGGAWTRTILYRFSGGADGGYPLGLVQGKDGTLYGYTLSGAVFSLEKPTAPSTAWRYRKLHDFKGGSDGNYPDGIGLLPDGSLVGTTSHGGTGDCRLPGNDAPDGCGIVFQLKPPAKAGNPWIETILHAFTGRSDGALPNGAPILVGGSLWGVTVEGGSGDCLEPGAATVAGCGTVYKLVQTASGAWTESIVYSFSGGARGWGPIAGLAADRNGNLYGVTAFGGDTGSYYGDGIVYRLAAGANGPIMSILHVFSGPADGRQPEGGLIVLPSGQAVYGTTYLGPDGYFGTVFKLAQRPAGSDRWSESIIGKFSSSGGVYPSGAIARDRDGAIYGVTLQGGKFNQGTVFSVTE